VRNEGNVFVNIELNISATYNVKEIVIQRRSEYGEYQYLTTLQPSAYKLNYFFNDFYPLINFSFYRAIIVLDSGSNIELEEVEVFFPDESTLEIYPNPIVQNDFFTLLARGDGGILEMIDLTGTIVRQWEINSDVADYELPPVLKGIYILQLKRGKTVFGRSRILVY